MDFQHISSSSSSSSSSRDISYTILLYLLEKDIKEIST